MPLLNANAQISQFEEKYKRLGRLKGCDLAGPGAQIYQCKENDSGEERSMKVIKKAQCTYLEFLEEVSILKECKGHPNLMDVMDTYEDYKFYFMVTENVKHPSLYQSLEAIDSPEKVITVVKTILNALVYLHDPQNPSKRYHQKIVHGKIHPNNILIPDPNALETLLLVEFSSAEMDLSGVGDIDETQFVSPDHIVVEDSSDSDSSDSGSDSDSDDERGKQKHLRKHRKKKKGGSHFHPPEYFKTGPSTAGDIWALGVLTFLLCTGHYPFHKPSDTKNPIQEWHGIEGEGNLKHFIEALLTTDPNFRPTAKAANEMTFGWIKDDKMLTDDAFHSNFKEVLGRLYKLNREHEFQVAVRSYISANFLTDQDQNKLEEVFREIDFRNNNALSRVEFVRAVFEADPGVPLKAIHKYFERMDHNGDKTVSYTEFMAFAQDEEVLLERENLRKAFEAFDVSNTGYITADDLLRFSASVGGASAFRGEKVLHKKTIIDMMKHADHNEDNKISFEEFVNMMTNNRKEIWRAKRSKERKKSSKRKSKAEKKSRKAHYAQLLQKKDSRVETLLSTGSQSP